MGEEKQGEHNWRLLLQQYDRGVDRLYYMCRKCKTSTHVFYDTCTETHLSPPLKDLPPCQPLSH